MTGSGQKPLFVVEILGDSKKTRKANIETSRNLMQIERWAESKDELQI
jgi:hypothetical protein